MDFEAKVQGVYEAVLRPGMGAVDVGAHVGRHGMEMVKCVAPGGHVMMFEPLPDLFATLHDRVKADDAINACAEVYPFALSDTTGETEFCVAVDAPGFSGLRERRYDVPTRVRRINVSVRRLDDIAKLMVRVDYIKIDTEGAEWNVLKGASQTIDRHRPVITFEFGENSYSAFDVNPVDVYSFFARKSFWVLDILGRRLDEAGFRSSSVRQEVWDYVAIPNEKFDQINSNWRQARSEI
jgi:FkbM family methyltransferase